MTAMDWPIRRMMKAIMPKALPEMNRAPFARRRREHRKIGAVGRLSIFAGAWCAACPGRDALGAARDRFRLEAQHHLLAVIRVDHHALEVDGFLWRLFGRARHLWPSFTVIVHAKQCDRPRYRVTRNPGALSGNLWTKLLISSG
jgi:hypothetical protein